MTTIAPADMERLAAEIVDGKIEAFDWCVSRGIELAAIAEIMAAAVAGIANRIAVEGDVAELVVEVVGQTFRLGWEACEQYGGRER